MRISSDYIEIIKKYSYKYFGDDSKVYLFGSRTDDSKFGGDIDIYIEPVYNEDVFSQIIKFLVELKNITGKRKIDIVINNGKYQLPVYEFAKAEGILF
jgi:predicted nucleotidyltransferase